MKKAGKFFVICGIALAVVGVIYQVYFMVDYFVPYMNESKYLMPASTVRVNYVMVIKELLLDFLVPAAFLSGIGCVIGEIAKANEKSIDKKDESLEAICASEGEIVAEEVVEEEVVEEEDAEEEVVAEEVVEEEVVEEEAVEEEAVEEEAVEEEVVEEEAVEEDAEEEDAEEEVVEEEEETEEEAK